MHQNPPSEQEIPQTTNRLFRRQAVEQATVKQYGTVILAHSVSYRILTLVFVGVAIGIIAFFILFSTTRKEQCQGIILPTTGVMRVLPMQAGVIVDKRVIEGQSVKAGDVLFVLSSERSSLRDGNSEMTISNLLQSRRDSFGVEIKQSDLQAKQRATATQKRIVDLQGESQKLDSQISLQQQRVDLSEQAYKRYSQLQATNYISSAQLQDKQADLLDQRQRLGDLQRAKSVSERDIDVAQADLRDMQMQAGRDKAALQRNVSVVDQDLTDNEARREILVRARQAGVVTAITAEIGQTVGTGQALASILPAGVELEAEIYAPSRSVGFVKSGMDVLIRYQAYPYQKFGQYHAHVREVAVTSLRPEELTLPGAPLASGATAEPLYRIRLKLDKQTIQAYGQSLPLKSGMLVDASIMLEKRRLYEWILEPLFSISGRI